jgi:hypothetical protein
MEDLSDDEIDAFLLSMAVWGNIDALEDRIIELESREHTTWENRLEAEKEILKAKSEMSDLLKIVKKKGL